MLIDKPLPCRELPAGSILTGTMIIVYASEWAPLCLLLLPQFSPGRAVSEGPDIGSMIPADPLSHVGGKLDVESLKTPWYVSITCHTIFSWIIKFWALR